MASGDVNMVDELETSFQTCLSQLMSQEHFNIDNDSDEIKTNVEASIQKFLDSARQLDSFFVQKRLVLTTHSPNLAAKDDIEDLRCELQRKDAALQRVQAKMLQWKDILNRSTGQSGHSTATGGTPPSQGHGQQVQGQPGTLQQPAGPGQMQGSMAPTAGQQQQLQLQQQQQQQQQQQAGFNTGPLAHLEQTTSNIGSQRMN